MDSTLYWLWLAEALGSGCRLAGRLLEEYPDLAELYGRVKAGRNPPEYLSARAREFMQAVAPAQMAGLKKRCDDLNIFLKRISDSMSMKEMWHGRTATGRQTAAQ